MRDADRSGKIGAQIRLFRPPLSFLFSRLPSHIQQRAAKVFGKERGQAANGAGRHHLHLSDASADAAIQSRRLSNLRYGAGANRRRRKDRSKRGIDRHDAPVLDRRRARSSRCSPRNGRTLPGSEPSPFRLTPIIGLAPILARHTSCRMGGMAVFRTRLGVGAQPIAQHVQPDRARYRRRLSLQHRRNLRARAFPGEFAARRCCGGLLRGCGGHHRACPHWTSSGTSRPREDRERNSRFVEPCAENRATYPRRR